MAISVGSVSVDVVPSAETFARDLRKKLIPQAAVVGKEMGKRIAEEVGKALGDAKVSAPEEKYRKEGARVGGAFGSALKKSIEAAIQSLPEIEIDADASDAQREIAEIRANLTELSDKRIGIDLDADEAERQLDAFRARLATLANQKDISLDVKADTASAVAAIDKFKTQAASMRDVKVNVDADTAGATSKLAAFQARAQLVRDIRTTLDLDVGAAMGKLALVNAGLLAIPAAAGSAAYSIGAIGAALVPAAGAALLLPAAIGGIGLAFGAVKVATSGFADAMKYAFDPTKVKEFQEALAKLSPEARNTVLAIQGLKPALDTVKTATQDAFFRGLGPMITSLGGTYLPILGAGFEGVATSINTATRNTGAWLQTTPGIAAVTTLVDSSKTAFDNLSQAFAPLVTAFVQIGAIGGPILSDLTQGAGSVARSFAGWVQSAEGINTIRAWIYGALDALGDLLLIARNVGTALGGLFSAAQAAGSNFLDTLVRVTGEVSRFLNSAQGQSALVSLFTNIRSAIDAAMPGFRVILDAVGYLITNLAPLLPQVGAAFSAVVGAARPLFDILVQLVATVLPPLLRLITDAPGAFLALVGAVGLAVGAFKAFIAVGNIVKAVETTLAILKTSTVLPAIWGTVTALYAQAAAFVAAYWPIMLIIGVIAALVAGVIYAWNNFDWFRNAVTTAWNAIVAVASWAWNTLLKPIFDAIGIAIGWVVDHWRIFATVILVILGPIGLVIAAFTLFRDHTMAVLSAVGGFFSWLWTTILSPIFSAIGTALAYLGAIIFTVLVAPFIIAWNLISAAVSFAWNSVILPIWNALVWFAQNVIAPAITWLYSNVFLPVWNAIGAAVSWVWNTILKPIWDFLVWYVSVLIPQWLNFLYYTVFLPIWNAIGAVISFVWNTIIKPLWDFLVWYVTVAIPNALNWFYNSVVLPVWNAIGAIISFIWNSVIRPTWDALVYFVQQIMAPAIQWLYNNIVKPVWDAIGAAINFVWTNVIQPAFNAIWGGLQWLGARFQDGVNNIMRIWDTIRGILARPINFMIGTVFNNGIAKAWNWVAGLIGIPPIAPLPLIPEFATGGEINGPGTGTSDSILAKVSNGEFVVREKVTRQVAPFLSALNAGDGEALQAAGAGAAPKRFTGKSGLGMDPMAGVPGFAVGGLIDERINAAKQWLSGPARGAPYVYGGGTNPRRGMDCSSMQSAVTHILSGRNPDSGRIGATGSMPWGGFVPGINGAYAIGNKPNDHMAATLGGQNVEQHGPNGTPFAFPSRWGADNGYFPQKFHLQEVGGNFVSGGAGSGGSSWYNPVPALFDGARDLAVKALKAFVGEPPPRWREVPPGLTTKAFDSVRDFASSKFEAMFGGGGGGGAMGATSDEAPGIVRIISDVARGRFGGLAKKAAIIGTATGLVESDLRNLAGGDRDSVGVFQQRPSQGWGTIEECRNVTHAAGSFFARFPAGWAGMDPGAVAQGVQRSAFPLKYGQRMGQATQLVNQFGGFDRGGLATDIGVLPKYTIQPERVLSPRQTQSFETLVRNLDSGATSTNGNAGNPGTFTGNLYLDSGEFMGKVHGSIGSANEDAARQLTYGRS